MGQRKPRYFMLFYYDDDTKTFNVTGPISDGQAVTSATVKLQESGRNVRISMTNSEMDVREVPAAEYLIKTCKNTISYRHDPNLRW